MKTINEDFDSLIRQFMQGDISKEDLVKLNAFACQSEENRQYVRNMRELLFDRSATKADEEFDVEQALARFHAHVNAAKAQQTGAKATLMKRMLRVAAAILLAILPIAGYLLGKQGGNSQFAMIETSAPRGSQVNIVLPDGSKVRLNAGSTIRYSQGFGLSHRKIYLRGEAFFEVIHNNSMPLAVITRGLVLHDLGTAFKVSDYKEDTHISVSLYEGELSVDNLVSSQKGMSMIPGERMVVDKKTGKTLKENLTETIEEGASMNTLYFDNQPLADIARVLSRSFDVQIDVAKPVRNMPFYLIFNKRTNNIDQILHTMAQTGHIKCRKANGHYLLY